VSPLTLRLRRFVAFWVELVLISAVLVVALGATFHWRNRLDRTPAQIQSFQDRQLRTSDGTAYWTQGEAGIDLVLIHGVLASKFTFEPVRALLTPRFRLWAYDVKGMGFTAAEGDIGLDGQVEQLRRFLEEMKLTQVVLLGHSTGGGIAQAFAARHPKSVRHLILVDSVDYSENNLRGNWESTNLRELVFAALRSPYLPELMPHLSGRWITRRLLSHQYGSPDRLTEATVLAHSYPMKLPGYWERANEWLMPPSPAWTKLIEGSFGTNSFPVTVLWGINDGWFLPRQGQQLCQRYRNCSFLLIEDAGHLPQEEQPGRFAERLTALLF
jgi:pimeloyl-ACP methyl ester carboxylesterase